MRNKFLEAMQVETHNACNKIEAQLIQIRVKPSLALLK
jgi:hypothetical protein